MDRFNHRNLLGFHKNRGTKELLSHHVGCILRSELLLDDDMQLLLMQWEQNEVVEPDEVNYLMFGSVSLVLLGAFTTFECGSNVPVAASLVPVVFKIFTELLQLYKVKCYKSNLEELIKQFKQLYELTRATATYFKKREESCPRRDNAVLVSFVTDLKCQKYLHILFREILVILRELVAAIRRISSFDLLQDLEFVDLSNYSLDSYSTVDFEDPSAVVAACLRLVDTCLLLMSNFLCGAGLIFCIKIWKKLDATFMTILDETIPDLVKLSSSRMNQIQTEFNYVRLTLVCNDMKLKKQSQSSRLQSHLLDYLTHTQLSFEIGTKLYEKLNNKLELSHNVLENEIKKLKTNSMYSKISLELFDSTYQTLLGGVTETKVPLLASPATSTGEPDNAEIPVEDPLPVLQDELYTLFLSSNEQIDSPIESFSRDELNVSPEQLHSLMDELKLRLETVNNQRKAISNFDTKHGANEDTEEKLELKKLALIEEFCERDQSLFQGMTSLLQPDWLAAQAKTPFLVEEPLPALNIIPPPPPPPMQTSGELEEPTDAVPQNYLAAIKSVAKSRPHKEDVFKS